MRIVSRRRIIAIALACGCSTLLGSACDQVTPEGLQHRERLRRKARLKPLVGMTRDEVRADMGDPDRTQDGTVGPCWGPQEALWAVLGEGTAYEEWVWTDGKWVMYAWFAASGGTTGNRSAWTVVEVGVGRTDVVY